MKNTQHECGILLTEAERAWGAWCLINATLASGKERTRWRRAVGRFLPGGWRQWKVVIHKETNTLCLVHKPSGAIYPLLPP